MIDPKFRLTHLEETKALVDAGINPDVATWDDNILESASIALDAAQAEKVNRLTVKKNSDRATL